MLMTNSPAYIPVFRKTRVIPLAMSTVDRVISSLQKGIFKSWRYGGEDDNNVASDLNYCQTQLFSMGLTSFAIVMRIWLAIMIG